MAPTTPLPAGTNKGAIGAPLLQGAQPTVSLSYGMDAPISGATPVIPLALAVWCSCISVFLLYSWFFATPPLLLRVPRTAWALMHALGTTLTSGVIVISAAIESLVIKAREPDVMRFWFDRVPKLDGAINLPALTFAMVSGVGIAAHKYGHFSAAPNHVVATVELLVVFACWWGLFDVRTQLAAQREVAAGAGSKAGPLPPALRARNPINVVSCAFVLALYVLMVVKPDVPLPFRPHGFAQRM